MPNAAAGDLGAAAIPAPGPGGPVTGASTPRPAAAVRRLPGLGDDPGKGLPERADRAASLQQRRKARVRALPVATALNRCSSRRMPFDFTLNPYRGCELGCVYCYARYTHGYLGRDDPEAFESEIFAKAGMDGLLRRELARRDMTGACIALGTVTDPYQPAERRLGLTRRLLQALALARGLVLSITTKSDLLVRDLDLMQAIARHNRFHLNMTIVTLDAGLARRLEPRAPRPELRLAALRRASAAGIECGVFVMPVLPALTDGRADMDALAAAARASGARYLCAQPVFLRDAARSTFEAFLAREFPGLLPRYRRAFGARAFAPESYRRRLKQRIDGLRARHDLGRGPLAERWDMLAP